jgi:uncharacterized protein
MRTNGRIDYIEFPCRDIQASKTFFSKAFGWRFTDYGPDYAAFDQAGLDGGFFTSQKVARTDAGSALMVLYSDSLEKTLDAVREAGGRLERPIFSFPGGRRFHFTDPSGNEYAVWSDVGADAGSTGSV